MNNFPNPNAVRYPLLGTVEYFVSALAYVRQVRERSTGDHDRKRAVKAEIREEDVVINEGR